MLLQHCIMLRSIFSSSSVVSHAFSALCMYSKFVHHPHLLGYTFVPNFVPFAASITELAHGQKSRTHSITRPAYLMPRNQSACTSEYTKCCFITTRKVHHSMTAIKQQKIISSPQRHRYNTVHIISTAADVTKFHTCGMYGTTDRMKIYLIR